MQLSDESGHCNFSCCEVKCELVCLIKNKTSERQREGGERDAAKVRPTAGKHFKHICICIYRLGGISYNGTTFAHPHSCQYSKCVALVSRLTWHKDWKIASSKLLNAPFHCLNTGITLCYWDSSGQ